MMLALPGYILGIDGGGTKTIARLIDVGSRQQWEAKGGAASLTNDFAGAVDTLSNLIMSLLTRAEVHPEQVVSVIGVAGAGSSARASKLRQALDLPFAELIICNDARTSLYGANLGHPIAMVALGTGSVGARLDAQGEISFYGGWGFSAGDEGGGAKLGLQTVKCALAELDKSGGLKSALAKRVGMEIGTNRDSILTWLSAAGPADFARFSHLVFELAGSCPVANNIILIHCQHVEQLIACTVADSGLQVVMLGGLAEPTQLYLSCETHGLLTEPKGTALDGACLMAQRVVDERINFGVTDNAS
ncbi:BadF/BadG/BcrA/BcrD ATPase family protein [Neptunicella sp. SCSIO 80796]|uniref:BadF/BadG/BcrA/BcrD ATPase family protein n=1 Tax=Neptunicella plasticusilytica TaxID=3117012 RepID=UPI003A4D29F6